MGWNVDNKPVNATDMYEARCLRSAVTWRGWDVTGPGAGGRTEFAVIDLAEARGIVGTDRRCLIYGIMPNNLQVLVTRRNLKVLDDVIEGENEENRVENELNATPEAAGIDEWPDHKTLVVMPNMGLMRFKNLNDALSHRDVPTNAKIYKAPADFIGHATIDDVDELVKKHLPEKVEFIPSPTRKRDIYYDLLRLASTPEQLSEGGDTQENGDMAAKAKRKASAKAKTPKAPKAANGEGREYKRTDPESKIKVLVEENPKRKGSASFDRFKKYADGMTVAEYRKKGGRAADIAYDVAHEYIKLS